MFYKWFNTYYVSCMDIMECLSDKKNYKKTNTNGRHICQISHARCVSVSHIQLLHCTHVLYLIKIVKLFGTVCTERSAFASSEILFVDHETKRQKIYYYCVLHLRIFTPMNEKQLNRNKSIHWSKCDSFALHLS